MPPVETINFGLAISALVVSLLLAFFNWKVDRRKTRIDNLISVYQFLHENSLSESRQKVRDSGGTLSISDKNMRQVCSSFDFAAGMIRIGAVDIEDFLKYWGRSIRSIETPVREIEDSIVGRNKLGSPIRLKEYYADFWWLLGEVNK